MKSYLLLLSLGLLLSQNIFAQGLQPQACPEISVLKTVTFTQVNMDQWVALTNGNFGTPQQWTFFMHAFGTNEKELLKQANANLVLLTVMSGPKQDNGQWLCGYWSSDKKIWAGAVNPPTGDINQIRMGFSHIAA